MQNSFRAKRRIAEKRFGTESFGWLAKRWTTKNRKITIVR
jgi:hypothetical protein